MRVAKILKAASPLVFLAGGLLAVDVVQESVTLAITWLIVGLVGGLVIRVIANIGQVLFEQRGALMQALQNTERSLFQIGSCSKDIRDIVTASASAEQKEKVFSA